MDKCWNDDIDHDLMIMISQLFDVVFKGVWTQTYGFENFVIWFMNFCRLRSRTSHKSKESDVQVMMTHVSQLDEIEEHDDQEFLMSNMFFFSSNVYVCVSVCECV
jgi:hypothetical protein